MADDIRELCCLIVGDIAPFIVTISANAGLASLKQHILECGFGVSHILAKDLVLWKVSIKLTDQDDDTLKQIEVGEDAVELKVWGPISNYWPVQTSGTEIDVLVRHVTNYYIPNDVFDYKLSRLRELFWGVSCSPHMVPISTVIPDARTLNTEGEASIFEIINLPNDAAFPDGSSELLISDTYKTFWGLLCEDDEEWQRRHLFTAPFASPSHATVITGQPGIGKTIFLNYVLVRRLQKKLVTIYCGSPGFAYIFSGDGVRKMLLDSGARIRELDQNSLCCALVNLGGQLMQAPAQFYPSWRVGRVVIATSPNVAHLSNFSKEHIANTYYMPTWSWDDIYRGSLVFTKSITFPTAFPAVFPTALNIPRAEKLRAAYCKFRGIPRVCFYTFLEESAMITYRAKINGALQNMPPIESLVNSVSGPMPFTDAIRHTIVRIEPVDDTHWRKVRTELSSDHISRLVFERIRFYKSIKLSQSITALLHDPATHGYARTLFEQAVHHRFRAGICFQPEAITEKAPSLTVDILKENGNEDQYFYTLSVQDGEDSHNVKKKYLRQYMMPILKTQESIDAVCISAKSTVFFQVAVSPHHPVELRGTSQLVNELPANPKKHISIVFVVPIDDGTTKKFKRQEIICPAGTPEVEVEEVRKYPQYVYYFDLRKCDA